MKQRPILFSDLMVRALLKDQKTQTRRILKRQPKMDDGSYAEWCRIEQIGNFFHIMADKPNPAMFIVLCPYGHFFDQLWVREAWSQPTTLDPGPTFYRADYPDCVPPEYENLPPITQIKWKPSIHMFRKDSRITLEITDVRIERLNDISEEDARAEGITDGGCTNCGNSEQDCDCLNPSPSAKDAFITLWRMIHGKDAWELNPFVWVISFKRIERE